MSVPRSLTLFDSNEPFLYTDSSYSAQLRLGHPVPFVRNMDFQIEGNAEHKYFDYPDIEDSVLTDHPMFKPNERGMYQHFYQFPLKLTLTYDNTDAPFVPTRGSRISTTWRYVNVTKYNGENITSRSNTLNHDFQRLDFVAQHYFYLGKDDSQYGLSVKEAREFRKFYTDFSWEETMRLWRPENIRTTLLNRRVLAVQLRLSEMWEMEKGGAPFSAFPTAGGTYPLRGYTMRFTDYSVKGISLEYRWPIDHLVDGVIFDEYVMYGRHWYSLDGEKMVNSWGFGIRVRKPDLYLFRIQLAFHGFDGFAAICTVAPEFQ
jgi:outer membrane protein assembly factor BamA